MTIVGSTESSREALNHLRSVKPYDGWSVQIKAQKDDDDGVRLCRRNAPLTDHFFLDIHHNLQTNTIVGVLAKDASVCQILVDGQNCRPVLQKKIEYVDCTGSYKGYKPLSKAEKTGAIPRRAASSSQNRTARTTGASTMRNNNNNNAVPPAPLDMNNPFANLSEEEKQLYTKYATYAVGAYVAYSVLTSILGEGFLFFLILPGLYVYGLQTCPPNATFDAKKEVKRVLRGHHLPDDHPQKPRKGNFLEEWTTRIAASVATEVGAAAGGYSVEITPLLGGVAKFASVTLPSLGLTCEWIGCNDTWYHYRTYAPSELQ